MSGDFGQRMAPVNVGDELDVEIEAVGAKGDGIAKKDGFVLFVPNTNEGDHVRIKVKKVLRKVGFAEVVGEAGSPSMQEATEEDQQEEEEFDTSQDTEDFGEETEEELPETTEEEKKEEESIETEEEAIEDEATEEEDQQEETEEEKKEE